MEDFKSKLFNLRRIQDHANLPIIRDACIESESLYEIDFPQNTPCEQERPSDQEILESIDSNYFDKEFDAGRYILESFFNQFEDMANLKKIKSDLKQLKAQHSVVSNHVLQMILEKQSVCQEEFNRILDIQSAIVDMLKYVKQGRNSLGIATNRFTTASLGILVNYRKRTLVQQLLRYLTTVKTLHETESKLPQLLKAGNFAGAIDLLLEGQGVASMYCHFTCVTALSRHLQDNLLMAEDQLEVTLAKMCYHFEEDVYSKLQSAYSLLGKIPEVMDKFLVFFSSAVKTTASKVVCSFIEPSRNCDELQYSQICREVSYDKFIRCLLDVCKSLWYITLSYHHVVNWHQTNPQINQGNDFECNLNEQQVKQKLNNGLTQLWLVVQTRVSSLVMAAKIENYKIDDFLKVLGILHRLSQIGEELCKSNSEELANSIKAQSCKYFRTFHTAKLDDLKVFLENETWTLCPVKSDFRVLHLQEYQGLRNSVEQCAGIGSHEAYSTDSRSASGNFFQQFLDCKNGSTPFDDFKIDSEEEDIMTNVPNDPSGSYSEESEEDVAVSSFIESDREKKRRSEHHTKVLDIPMLTNTTLTVLRLCGKYLQMSQLLKSISNEVIVALTQLFEYYLYTVFIFFSSDIPDMFCGNITSLKLQSVIKRISENLIEKIHSSEGYETKAQLSPMVILDLPERLYGLSERVVAVESLNFLAQEFTFLRPYLEQLMPSSHFLNQFYSQTVSVSAEVRKPVYAAVSWKVIDTKHTLSLMNKVDWEVKEVVTKHSKYIDFLIEANIMLIALSNNMPPKHLPLSSTTSAAVEISRLEILGFSNYIFTRIRTPDQQVPRIKNIYMLLNRAEESDAIMQHRLKKNIHELLDLNKQFMLLNHAAFQYDYSYYGYSLHPIVNIVKMNKELLTFKKRLEDIKNTLWIPEIAENILWENIVLLLNYLFVEGFGSTKKCSAGGRGLMDLDFTQLISKLDKLCPAQIVPNKEFVKVYIKAYYQSEEYIENLIKEHKEYSAKQLQSLVSCASQIDKKSRQRLTVLIEELEKAKTR